MTSSTISINFLGDLYVGGEYERWLTEGSRDPFVGFKKALGSADLCVFNLECPLTTETVAWPKSGPSLKASPKCAALLRKSGLGLAVLANNHMMDYGAAGLSETMQCCSDAGMQTVGAGSSVEEALAPCIYNKNGISVAIFAFGEHEFGQAGKNTPGIAPLDCVKNLAEINKVKTRCNFIVVNIHGNCEYFPFPRPNLRELCRFYIDCGVDAVICHHSHVPSAFEYYRGKYISYGIGNFLFDHQSSPPCMWDVGYMVRLTMNLGNGAGVSVGMIPYRQSIRDGGVVELSGEQGDDLMTQVRNCSDQLQDDMVYESKWRNFCLSKKAEVIMRMSFPEYVRGAGIMDRIFGLENILIPRRRSRLARLNMIRCESHRDVMAYIFQEISNINKANEPDSGGAS